MRTHTAAKAIALVSAAALVSACTGGGGGGSGPAAFTPSVAASAPAGANDVAAVNWNLANGEPASLDPALSAVDSNSTVVGNMCEALFRWKDDYTPEPALATSVEHPTPTSWTFKLRQGVKFWDGTPMTADDVVYSIMRVLNPDLGSPWAGWTNEAPTIKAVDDLTVSVSVPTYNSMIEDYFQTPAFTVVSKAFTEKAGKAFGTSSGGVMCTGPYQLADWKSGQSIELKRNDAWWDTSSKPKVADITFKFVTDPAAATAGLVKGDIDGQFGLPNSAYQQLSGAGNLLFGRSLAPTFIAPLDLNGPMGDPKVRQALSKSIDYQGIVKAIYLSAATTLKALVPPAAYGYAKDVYQPAYDALPEPKQDLEAAKKLVSESPKAKDQIILAYFTGSAEETKTATAIADTANSVGLNIQLKPMDATAYFAIFSSAEARKGIDAFVVSGYLDYPDPLQYYQYFTIGSFYNFVNYNNEKYTKLINNALGDQNPTTKAQSVVDAQAIMNDELITIPLLTTYVSVFYGKKLGGYRPAQNYLYTPWATELGGA